MYIDKPMQGHGLMQAIARVNRVLRDKPGGLVVDYLGLADQLKEALHTYAESRGKGKLELDQEKAVALMLGRYEVCCDIFHGFDWSAWTSSSPAARLSVLPAAQEHVLAQESGKERLLQVVTELSKAFALAVPHEEAIRIRDDVGFFQAVRAVLAKLQVGDRTGSNDIDHAIRQIVSKAIVSEQVIDIFAAAGLKNPDISILSDEFLADVRGMQHRNLAVELLRKLLNDEVKARSKQNLVQARSFADLLEGVLGNETLRTIARELVGTVKQNVTIDWTVKESVRAKLRVIVKRILRKYGYPPDKQEAATNTVLQQAELLSDTWTQDAFS